MAGSARAWLRTTGRTVLGRVGDRPQHAALWGLVLGLGAAGADLVLPLPIAAVFVAAATVALLGTVARAWAKPRPEPIGHADPAPPAEPIGRRGTARSAPPVRRPGAAAVAFLALAGALGGLVAGAARVEALDAAMRPPAAGTRIEGRAVLLEPVRPGRFESSAPVRLAEGSSAGLRLVARVPAALALAPNASPGAVLALEGSVARAPDDPEWAAHLRRRGIAGELRVSALADTGRRRGGWRGVVDAMRTRGEAALGTGLGPIEAALARGMVLGQDEHVPAAVRDDFRRAGLAHLLAVSGQNVMLLAALALPLLSLGGLGARARLWALLGLIALYVPLAGAGPSLQRAGVMGAAGVAALLAGRPSSRWYALGLAGLVTLALDPRTVGDPGWQLSFVAVAGILCSGVGGRPRAAGGGGGGTGGGSGAVAGARAARAAAALYALASGRLACVLLDGVRLTLAATLATAPLLALHFGTVSLAGLVTNVLALPAVGPVMWTGMLQVALGQAAGVPVLGAVTAPGIAALAYPAEAGLGVLAALARRFADAPGAAIEATLDGPLDALGAYAVLALAAVLGRAAVRRTATRRMEVAGGLARAGAARCAALALGLAALVVTAGHAWLGPGPAPDRVTVSFLDVGQGDATLVQDGAGAAVLFDGGPPEGRVVGLLRRAGVRRLSLVVATHASRDHHGGLADVLEAYPVDLLLDGGDGSRDAAYRRVLTTADRRRVPRAAAVAGQMLRAGGLTVRVLGPASRPPGPPPGDPNPRAVVAAVTAGEFDLFLSGDAESDALAALPLGDVEAIKVSHHGSADAGLPGLLARLRPEVAVVEVGADNPYGHPSPATLAALRAAVPRVLRTDRDGTVRLEVADGALTVGAGR